MYNLINNCISKEELATIQNTLIYDELPNFPWYYSQYKVSKFEKFQITNSKYDFQFTHVFYDKFQPRSAFVSILEPILKILDPSAILRIKANLIPITTDIITYAYHKDFENFDGETAIFYVNNNNGYTIFKNGDVFNSLENQLITFPAELEHTGTSCTDEKVRCVINFNYYKWKI